MTALRRQAKEHEHSLKEVADWYRRVGENYHNTPLHLRNGPLILPNVDEICKEAFVIAAHQPRPALLALFEIVNKRVRAARNALNVKWMIEAERWLGFVLEKLREAVMRLEHLQWSVERMRDPLNTQLAEERFFLKQEERERVRMKEEWVRSLPVICYDQAYKEKRAEQDKRVPATE